MRLPEFLIIGASKSGTTTLYDYLCKHPEIYMTTPKSLAFFSRDDNYVKGIEWYASHFEQATLQQICGEASPCQTHWPQYPQSSERIAKHLPNIKLLYIMRNPVDRAYSQYVQNIKSDQRNKRCLKIEETFEESVKYNKYIIETGNYLKQIELYLRFFPEESFLFLLMEDLIKDPKTTLDKIYEFIGVDRSVNVVEDEIIASNQAKTHAEWFLRSRMTQPIKKIPGMKTFADLFPQELRDLAYDKLISNLPYRKQMEKEYLPQKMLPETRAKLVEYFQEPNQKLGEFLGRDLSHWNQ